MVIKAFSEPEIRAPTRISFIIRQKLFIRKDFRAITNQIGTPEYDRKFRSKSTPMDAVFIVKIGLFVVLAVVALVNYVSWVESGEE